MHRVGDPSTYKQIISQVGQKFPDKVSKTFHVYTFHLKYLCVREKAKKHSLPNGIKLNFEYDHLFRVRFSNFKPVTFP